MATKRQADKAILEAHKLAEIYKAGFVDGHETATGEVIKWSRVWRKCAKAFNIRFSEQEQNRNI